MLAVSMILSACNAGKYYAHKKINRHYEEVTETKVTESTENAEELPVTDEIEPVTKVEENKTADVPQVVVTPKKEIAAKPHIQVKKFDPVKTAKFEIIPSGIQSKSLKNHAGINEMYKSGDFGRGLLMILMAVLMVLLGLVFFLYLGAFGLILWIIFLIAAIIMVIAGIIIML